jgi:hypothetical protein
MTRPALPAPVAATVEAYLRQADRLLPGVVTGFYVVGSVALGAYRERRSDLDVVAVVDDDLDAGAVRRLRLLHLRSGIRTAMAAIRAGRSPLTGACNGVVIRRRDLARPVSEIRPVASQTGHHFTTGPVGSDVSPVAWKVFAERGVAVRGDDPSSLGLDPQPDLLTSWNLGNLESYWRPWAESVRRSPGQFRLRPRYLTAWGVLGAPRLHHTIATGEIVSKEAAGEHALEVFPSGCHPLIGEALAYWRSEPDRLAASPSRRAHLTADFVTEVIDAAHALPR